MNLVQVPLLARGRGGRAVTDLRADEIVVKEGGRRMPVVFLEPLAAPMDAADIPGVNLVVSLPGGTQVSMRAGEPRLHHAIILVDVENDYVLNRPQVAEEVARLFIKQVRLSGQPLGPASVQKLRRDGVRVTGSAGSVHPPLCA